ncbi:hypothetical protein [Terracidiphilus gabretensis]|uniref:hypothetical protein n=1 Tax=Terracidiphilus gabretensis TaxID=1577687 RepID=UPI00071BA3DF|nr:hypothetical protein [Terracidiphilus gabretensis]
MQSRSLASNLGIYIYAAGAIFLGLLGLISGDFAATWQHVVLGAPIRTPLAYLTALIELAAGLALLWPRTARIGAITLTIVFSVFTLLWVPKILENPRVFDPIGNFFEEFSLVIAGSVLIASLSLTGSSLARREPLFARLYGLCAISFGIGHIVAMPGLLAWIPKWLPPSQLFWAYVTTIGFFLAAVAILSGILAPLASRLLTAEILCFEILVWVPFLVANPHGHFYWAGNAIDIAMIGAAWVVADSLSYAARHAGARTEPAAQTGVLA